MLHLRLIVPADRTESVVALLEGTVGTVHLVVLPGVARDPAGDLVTCDVARESADELLKQLCAQGLEEDGAITVHDVTVSLSDRADRAEREAPGEPADAVVWDQLVEATRQDSKLSVTHLAFLCLATMIAACAVVLDNAVLIVGATAVGPEFGPLAGICTAIVQRTARPAWRSIVALVVGFLAAMVVTTAFSVMMDAFGLFSENRLEAARPNTEFIWQPDPVSFVVAVLAGVAGTLSLTSSKSGALVGVAISVTTVPAAANAAVALSYGQYAQMAGSSRQLALNLAGILIAGTLTLLTQKIFWQRQRSRMVRTEEAPAG